MVEIQINVGRLKVIQSFYFIFLLSMFILHLRKSELYRCLLDGMSAVCEPPVFYTKVGPPRRMACASNLVALFSITSLECRASSREAVNTILKSFCCDSSREINPRSTDREANSLTTTPLRRLNSQI